jgi:hypothetical protein
MAAADAAKNTIPTTAQTLIVPFCRERGGERGWKREGRRERGRRREAK